MEGEVGSATAALLESVGVFFSCTCDGSKLSAIPPDVASRDVDFDGVDSLSSSPFFSLLSISLFRSSINALKEKEKEKEKEKL